MICKLYNYRKSDKEIEYIFLDTALKAEYNIENFILIQ